MPAAKILFLPKNNLSLVYNNYDNTLSGDTEFRVALAPFGDPPFDYDITLECDSILTLSDYDFNVEFAPAYITITPGAGFSLVPGSYDFIIKAENSQTPTNYLPVNLVVINDENTGGGTVDYELRYLMQEKSIDGSNIRCEIYKLGYEGESTDIFGTIKHSYQDKSDLYEPIVASNLSLELESSLDINLSELYSESEKDYKIILKRNDIIIFIGFLKPDGIFEDYVSDRWTLDISAYDGLSTLKSLSFVNDNGVSYSGKYSALDIVINALHKTGLDLPVNINCEIYYVGFTGYDFRNALEESFLNTERFYQNASEPMDCETVLKSTLQIFNLTIIQMFGEWWIYRSIDIKENVIFGHYINGIFNGNVVLSPTVNIGSQIDNFEVFHCNANQKKSIAASVQAYRVSYEYGPANSIFRNAELKLIGTGLDIDGWNVYNADGRVERLPDGYGLTSKTWWFGGEFPRLIQLNQSIRVNQGSVFKLVIRFANESINSKGLRFAVGVGGQYFNIENGEWGGFVSNFINNSNGTFSPPYNIYEGKGDASYDVTLRAPISGEMDIVIFRDVHENGGGDFKIYNVSLVGTNEGDIKGRDYIGRRKSLKSTVTKSNITVYNGDSLSDLFVGTIYKDDADTPTEKWIRPGRPEQKEILEINAEDNLRISPRPMSIFSGDIFGYIPYLSLINIENQGDKKYLPIKYSYDLLNAQIDLSSKEFSSDFIPDDDFTVQVKDNFGDETKVTIS